MREFLAILAPFMLLGLHSADVAAEVEVADLVFVNGRVLTMHDAQPEAQAVAVRGGLIVAVGEQADVDSMLGEDTQVIDLAGRRLIPGLIEGHGHFLGLGEDLRQARFLRQVELAAETALAHGITSFHDQGQRFDDIDRLVALDRSGGLPLRLYVAVIGETNADLDRRLPDYWLLAEAHGMLTVRSVKRHLDGALGTHGAWLLRPYADRSDTTGLPQMSLADLRETAAIAFRHGFQLNTHAIGDRANREALDVYASIQRLAGDDELRWRIEHAQNLHPDDVPRFAELGVIASMQGIHATSDGPWVPIRLGEQRAQRKAYVWRSLLDADAVICNGTDVPVESISPIASLHASITRQMANGERFFPEQRMDQLEALKSYTIHCAYAVYEEKRLGSIQPGKLADLVVLSADVMTVSEDELAELEVDLTVVGGDIRFER